MKGPVIAAQRWLCRLLAVALLATTVVVAESPRPAAAADDVAEYIDASYRLFLGRAATNRDVNYWYSTVHSGRRSAFTTSLAQSREWAGVRIDELYRVVLHRSPDPAGRDYWLGRIRSGLRLEDIAAMFYGSDEYFGHAGRTYRGFVDDLYLDLLDRRADRDGRAYWVGRLRSGALSRSGVAAGFYASIESRQARVTALYHAVLGRGPDPGGLDYWSGRVRTTGDIALSASLAASPEFYRRVTGVDPKPVPPDIVYTYDVRGRYNSGDLERFASLAAETLRTPRGWNLGGSIEFRRVSSGGHFTLWLASPGSMTSFSSGCSPSYSCRVGRNVIINERPWNNATPSWDSAGGSLRNYRHMVVNHEVGHWLGFGHSNCPGAGQRAPVMQQQSIDLQGCAFNPWPTTSERQRLANSRGVPIRG